MGIQVAEDGLQLGQRIVRNVDDVRLVGKHHRGGPGHVRPLDAPNGSLQHPQLRVGILRTGRLAAGGIGIVLGRLLWERFLLVSGIGGEAPERLAPGRDE